MTASCGNDEAPGTAAPSSSGAAAAADPTAILASVEAASGPQTISGTISIVAQGVPTEPIVAALLAQPAKVQIDGNIDAAQSAADLAVRIKIGPGSIDARFRTDGSKSWLAIGETWYEVDMATLTSVTGDLPSAPGLNVSTIREVLASPAALVESPTLVGPEMVGDVPCQHVKGVLNVEALLAAMAKGSGDATAPTPADVAKARETLRSADVDLWIGDTDNQVHRLQLVLDVDLEKAGGTATAGVAGATVGLNLTLFDTEKVDTSAPPDARPASDLVSALGGLFLPLLTGGAVS